MTVVTVSAMAAAALVAMLLALRDSKSFIIFLLGAGVLRFDTEVGNTVGGSSNLSSIWLLWLIVFCLFVLVHERVFRHKPTAPEIFYGIFLLWCGIEACLADNIAFAARTYLKLLYPLLAMVVVRLVVDGEQIASTLLRRVLMVAVVTCLLVGGLTARIVPTVLTLTSPFFWFGAVFADCAALMTMVALSAWRLERKSHYLAFAVLLGTSSLFAAIRTGVGATAIGVSIFAICVLGRKSLPLVLAIYLGSALAFVSLPEMRGKNFLDATHVQLTDVVNPVTVDYDNIDSSGRFTLWQNVMDRFFWDNPTMGSGLGTTQAWFYGGGYPGLLAEHSEYVHLLADTGIVGLALYLVAVAGCMVALWRCYRSTENRLVRYLSIATLAMFPAYLFCMGFDNVLNYVLPAGQYPFAFTGATIGLYRALEKQRSEAMNAVPAERQLPLSETPLPAVPRQSSHPPIR